VTTSEDINSIGLDLLLAALEAKSERESLEAVRAIVSDLSGDDLRRVTTWLAVQSIWRPWPRRSRRAIREAIEMRRFALLTSGLDVDRHA